MQGEMLKVNYLLNKLRASLIANDNVAYKYIDVLLEKFQSAKNSVREAALREIVSSAKMVEYANFTIDQERIWKELWTEAYRLVS